MLRPDSAAYRSILEQLALRRPRGPLKAEYAIVNDRMANYPHQAPQSCGSLILESA